jgi:hypothetical protein
MGCWCLGVILLLLFSDGGVGCAGGAAGWPLGWLVGGVRVVPWCLVAVVGLGLGYVLHRVWVSLVGIRLLGFRAWWDG